MFQIEALIWVLFWRILKFQLFKWRADSNSRRQFKNIKRKYKTHIKLVHELYGTLHVCSIMWKFKNQPSISTSCNDNALRLLVLVVRKLYWGFQVMSSFSIWGCVFKGCFERGIFWRAKLHLKGIEDFNLKHCHLYSNVYVGLVAWVLNLSKMVGSQLKEVGVYNLLFIYCRLPFEVSCCL